MPATFDSILNYTLPSNATSFTVSSISTAYTDLVVLIDGPAISEVSMDGNMQFNGDTANNYSYIRSQNDACDTGNNTTAASFSAPGNGGRFATKIEIFSYSNTTSGVNKTYIARGGSWQNIGHINEHYMGMWRNTASAINSITFISGQARNFIAGTKVQIFGILKA
jgi:hypothetical protein